MVKLKHLFPESFFIEEDRLGFHIDKNRKELWAVELDMLLELDRVCKKLKIKYFLDGGTLLGAARDGRIIPWDDDIDVAMLRDDYDRFVREAPDEFDYPLFLQTGYTEKNYFRGHCQLRNSLTSALLPNEWTKVSFNQGVFLDIFVLDDVFPEKLNRQYAERAMLWKTRKKWYHHDYHKNPIRYAVRWARYLLYHLRYPDSASFYRKIEHIFRSQEKSAYVDYLMLNAGPEQLHYLKRSWYEQTLFLCFEGFEFPVPKGYREYLQTYYGEDYMTPQNIPSMHNAGGQVIYDVNQPYTELIKTLCP